MPGPAPKPTELKRLSGNPGHRHLNDDEPQPDRIAPAIPRGLMPLARKFWKAHGPALERMGLLTEIDGAAFTMLTIHYEIAWKAAQILKEDGLVSIDENGAERKHPLHQVLRDNSAMLLRYSREFGMTPSARSRIAVPDPDDEMDIGAVLAQVMENL